MDLLVDPLNDRMVKQIKPPPHRPLDSKYIFLKPEFELKKKVLFQKKVMNNQCVCPAMPLMQEFLNSFYQIDPNRKKNNFAVSKNMTKLMRKDQIQFDENQKICYNFKLNEKLQSILNPLDIYQ